MGCGVEGRQGVGLSDLLFVCLDPDLIHFLSSLRPFHTFLLSDIFFSCCVCFVCVHGTFSYIQGVYILQQLITPSFVINDGSRTKLWVDEFPFFKVQSGCHHSFQGLNLLRKSNPVTSRESMSTFYRYRFRDTQSMYILSRCFQVRNVVCVRQSEVSDYSGSN